MTAKKTQAYGMDCKWTSADVAAYRHFCDLTGAQARAIFAWNHAKMRGEPVGPRPETVPALTLQARAFAMAAQ